MSDCYNMSCILYIYYMCVIWSIYCVCMSVYNYGLYIVYACQCIIMHGIELTSIQCVFTVYAVHIV